MDLQAPQPLAQHHSTVGFDCGDSSLDHWLQQRALTNQKGGATRSFVVCNGDDIVKAYVALASGSVAVASAPGRFRRNMPDPHSSGGVGAVGGLPQCPGTRHRSRTARRCV